MFVLTVTRNTSMQLHSESQPRTKKQQGAFLIVAMILLIVLSALGLAAMSEAVTSGRVSRNYSAYIQALEKATSMAQYAKRILETYPNATYPAPLTCDTIGVCGTFESVFPHNGRPYIAWTSGLGTALMNGASETNVWWSDHGLAYEGTFADTGIGNARVVVSLLSAKTTTPYEHTYRIVGYATDSSGTVKATYELFHVWEGYTPDPGDGTCAGGCRYTECCSDTNVCATDQASCELGSATYVPPGWTCSNYFETGLGYGSSACLNPIDPP